MVEEEEEAEIRDCEAQDPFKKVVASVRTFGLFQNLFLTAQGVLKRDFPVCLSLIGAWTFAHSELWKQ
jgi:hypothetical protein